MEKNFVSNGNLLINRFMGSYKMGGGAVIALKEYPTGIPGFNYDPSTYLKFHESWDWLMPVVEKIESLGYPVKITSKYCSVARDYTYKEPLVVSEFRDAKIKKVYDIVTGFITWYNKNK